MKLDSYVKLKEINLMVQLVKSFLLYVLINVERFKIIMFLEQQFMKNHHQFVCLLFIVVLLKMKKEDQ